MRIVNICRVTCLATILAACSSVPTGGLDPLGVNRRPIATGIDDAVTDVAFLDGYSPQKGTPVGLLPRGPNSALLALPGLWEGTFRSYCLHAGIHQPAEGDGYLSAPLRGPDAGIVRHILQNQAAHPELEQSRIQTLIWAILAGTKLSDTAPEVRKTAEALLSAEEIDRLNGGALGRIPPELLELLLSQLPPAARQLAQTNARLRGLLTSSVQVPFQQLEQIAAPLGDFLPPPDSRLVPAGRWSYDEVQRLFVRYFPRGYSKTRTQFYVPETLSVDRDPEGRISAIADRAGNRITIRYKPEPVPDPSDPGVKLLSFASLEMTGRDPQNPWVTRRVSLGDVGWVMLGSPSGSGNAAGPARQERYQLSIEQARQIGKLEAAVRRRNASHPPFDAVALAELSAYAAAFDDIGKNTKANDGLAGMGQDLFRRAWMSQLATGATHGTQGGGPREAASAAALAGSAAGLALYDPTGTVAQPGNTGKQRLAQSPADDCGANGADSIEMARRSTRMLSTGTSVAWRIGSGGGAPWSLPLWLNMRLINFNFDNASKINAALSGRDCGQNLAPRSLTASMGAETPSAADKNTAPDYGPAWSNLAAASTQLAATLDKADASATRYRSALAAGDQEAARGHARRMTAHLHESGLAMLRVSSGLTSLIQVLRADGEDQMVTLAAVQQYQQALKARGFSREELEVAKAMGMSNDAIAAALALRLEPVTGFRDTPILRLYGDAAQALWELGGLLANMQPSEHPEKPSVASK